MIDGIGNTGNIPGLNNQGSSVLSKEGGSFGDNPFLSLLVAEMRTQSPLEPVDNSAFMQQMASFSSMEEQKELNTNMLKLLDYQGALARLNGLSEGSSLLGKEVSYVGSEGTEENGVVDSVYVNEEGDLRLTIGESEFSMRDVVGIRTPSQTA